MSSGRRRRWTWWKIGDRRSRPKEEHGMDMKLELVIVPVADVDRAKAFYVDRLGFHLDVDHSPNAQFRVVQMTPPGSACSITVGVGIGAGEPGSVRGLHLVVADIEAAHAHLVEHGVDASEVFHFGADGRADGPDPQRGSYNSFVTFDDPDGNGWVVQEVHREAGG
jgi:catechol 2,3-dioxygenase-like lactoylglutathione lyase family enzyme